ncbi:helix-turn-helix domain-containing protein [Actinomadura oligospora]|uniref:helix-turn-helix domain-containing protein n=1 Tax=Actinomadura oligospora TaxID=111804 RepID=UPI00047DB333|nr:helix-turn-helix transcriptional regulator [Actinomadura oligospora]
MSPFRGPTVRQRRLAAELRRLREQSGFTGDDVAARLNWSTAKVSRIENARSSTKIRDVELLTRLYQIDPVHRAELITLAHDAAARGWWEEYRELPGGYTQFIAMEDEASRIVQWETYLVPGLLQTEEYAQRVMSGTRLYDTVPPRELERRIEVRLLRQRILHHLSKPVEYTLLLDESVLHRLVGDPAVMRAQLRHLLAVGDLPHVALRVIELAVPHPIMEGSFQLMEYDPVGDIVFPDVVYTEALTDNQITDEKVAFMYRLAFEGMSEVALGAAETRDLVSALADRW